MQGVRGTTGRLIVCFGAVTALFISGATASADRGPSPATGLHFKKCGLTTQAATTECATADLPLDYDQPRSGQVHIAIARVPAADQAHRIGVLFFNFGGPGEPPSTTSKIAERAPSGRRSTSGSTSSGSTRAASVRALRRSTARPTRRSRASTRSRSRRRSTSIATHSRQGRELHPRVRAAERQHPLARLDRQRRPRHGRDSRPPRRDAS